MVRVSVFSTLAGYFKDIYSALRSIYKASVTALLYVFSIGELQKEVTEQYPDPVSSRSADDLPPRVRGLLFNNIENCTGCGDCVQICPVQCINLETETGADSSKTWIAVFDIDFARCIFCGFCVEVCHPASLYHTKQYEGAVYNMRDLVARFGQGRVTPEQRAKWAAIRLDREAEGQAL